jgi:hypothetical protein
VGAVLGTIRRHMQFAEFETWPDHPGKRELLSGELIELPPAKQKHNQIAERIYLRLREILPEAGNPSLGEVHHEIGTCPVRRRWVKWIAGSWGVFRD